MGARTAALPAEGVLLALLTLLAALCAPAAALAVGAAAGILMSLVSNEVIVAGVVGVRGVGCSDLRSQRCLVLGSSGRSRPLAKMD
jgi:hypothetical protein